MGSKMRKGARKPTTSALGMPAVLTSQSRAPTIWEAFGLATWLIVWVAISACGEEQGGRQGCEAGL